MTRAAAFWKRLPCTSDPRVCPAPDGEHVWEYPGRCLHPLMYRALCEGRSCAACGVVEHRLIAPAILTVQEGPTQPGTIVRELHDCPSHQQHWAISHTYEEAPAGEPAATTAVSERASVALSGAVSAPAGTRTERVGGNLPDVRGDIASLAAVRLSPESRAGGNAVIDRRRASRLSWLPRQGRDDGGHWHINPDADWRWREDGLLVLILVVIFAAVWRFL